MAICIDHIVLWAEDPLRSVTFYEDVLGFAGVRVEEFRAGKVPFPSVRVTSDFIIDLMPLRGAPLLNAVPGAAGSAGNKVNHVCLAMSRGELDALRGRMQAHGVAVAFAMRDSFGARGSAPDAFYFTDPDGNVLEARCYD